MSKGAALKRQFLKQILGLALGLSVAGAASLARLGPLIGLEHLGGRHPDRDDFGVDAMIEVPAARASQPMPIKSHIRTVPHYPKAGVMFRDITTLLKDPIGFRLTISELSGRYDGAKIDKVAGIESRGFIIGAALAFQLGLGFVPIRKRGKLPAATVGHDYELEYGSDRIEMHVDAVSAGERVLLVDDLIATGGIAEAAVKLIEQTGGEVVECAFVIDLPDLGGRRRLEGHGLEVFALCQFEGD